MYISEFSEKRVVLSDGSVLTTDGEFDYDILKKIIEENDLRKLDEEGNNECNHQRA